MVDRNLLRSLDDDTLFGEMDAALALAEDLEQLDEYLIGHDTQVELDKIVEGKILRVDDDSVLIDIGYKSEGTIPLSEWDPLEDPPEPGDKVQVLVEEVEGAFGKVDDPAGMISLSRTKALQRLKWEAIIEHMSEGDVVTGRVGRKIKGGLLVDIGVSVFLPASQVDIRRPHDIGDYIGRVVQCEVLKIDDARNNIVVSRRSLIESQRKADREQLLGELVEGQQRKGVVKNIAEFGAFVDLGGIDGLLHITDMSWGRIGHPTEMVSIDQEIVVVILNIDHEKEKIALGLKQKFPSPWEQVGDKYPVDSRIKGTVVNVMSYGAFVKLEEGIEGLVHISEMSWVKRINHPSELVNIGDEIEVIVLGINKDKQEISLGMKQTQMNPWEEVAAKFPVGAMVKGKVRNLTNYGAFIELEEGIDGLLHISDMSWTKKVSHPSEVVEKGGEIECKVLSVDQERRRIALGMKQLDDDPWATDIPDRYTPGQLVEGTVTKITNFGVFVGLEDGLEGLLHISELADHKVENPEDVVNVGDKLEVKILRVDTDERKIGLSRKRVEWAAEDEAAALAQEEGVRADQASLKGGLGDGGPLIKPPVTEEAEAPEEAAAEPEAEAPEAETAEAETAETETTEVSEDSSAAEEASAEEEPEKTEAVAAKEDA